MGDNENAKTPEVSTAILVADDGSVSGPYEVTSIDRRQVGFSEVVSLRLKRATR